VLSVNLMCKLNTFFKITTFFSKNLNPY